MAKAQHFIDRIHARLRGDDVKRGLNLYQKAQDEGFTRGSPDNPTALDKLLILLSDVDPRAPGTSSGKPGTGKSARTIANTIGIIAKLKKSGVDISRFDLGDLIDAIKES